MMHLVRICSTRTFLDSWLRVTPPSGGTESPSAGGASVWTVQTIAARRCQHRRPRHQHKEDWEPSAVQPRLRFSLLLHGGNRAEFLDINSTYESQNLNHQLAELTSLCFKWNTTVFHLKRQKSKAISRQLDFEYFSPFFHMCVIVKFERYTHQVLSFLCLLSVCDSTISLHFFFLYLQTTKDFSRAVRNKRLH